ncbi:NAC domain-containing protein 91 [Vitis vinifera]|uniref:NAC domain-containing protein 91 n=1 Tax=Vitis vinifera TaxID=29760 RepID=A0A438HKX2_VITVI|nr:NAC domain-containing protein 91 [Vitis vinifera]
MSVGEIISRYLKSFPMGFGFHPTDEQLVVRYLIPKLRDEHSRLKMKMPGTDFQVDIIREVDVCQWEPWELPDELNHPDDPEWFFFSPLHKKMAVNSKGQQIRGSGIHRPWSFAVSAGWIIHEYHADKKFVRDDDDLAIDSDGFPYDRRSAVDSGNLGNCRIGRLLTCPQTPLKGAHDTASAVHEPSSPPGYLVNLLVGILLLVILIAVMVQDIRAKF